MHPRDQSSLSHEFAHGICVLETLPEWATPQISTGPVRSMEHSTCGEAVYLVSWTLSDHTCIAMLEYFRVYMSCILVLLLAVQNIIWQTSNLHVDMGVFRVNNKYCTKKRLISASRCHGNTPTANSCPSNIKGHVFKGRARDQKRHIVLNHLLMPRHWMCLG